MRIATIIMCLTTLAASASAWFDVVFILPKIKTEMMTIGISSIISATTLWVFSHSFLLVLLAKYLPFFCLLVLTSCCINPVWDRLKRVGILYYMSAFAFVSVAATSLFSKSLIELLIVISAEHKSTAKAYEKILDKSGNLDKAVRMIEAAKYLHIQGITK